MQNVKWTEAAVLPLTLILLAGFLFLERPSKAPDPLLEPLPSYIPDFSSYTDVKAKKRDFFNFMLPIIRNANILVSFEREFITTMIDKHTAGQTIPVDEQETIAVYKRKYRVKETLPTEEALELLLARVDIVPPSLVLAQAANESAWGTSRFARNGNNFFGIWCFSKGCGEIPKSRDAGKTHEVATFESIQAGVEYYLLTLNTHRAYEGLREIRSKARVRGISPQGIDLAEGLVKYSERGLPYVREIQAMIRVNQLAQFDISA